MITVFDTGSPWYLVWKDEMLAVRMDGKYTAEELRAIADRMDDEEKNVRTAISDIVQ